MFEGGWKDILWVSNNEIIHKRYTRRSRFEYLKAGQSAKFDIASKVLNRAKQEEYLWWVDWMWIE